MQPIACINDEFQATGRLQTPVISCSKPVDDDCHETLLTIRGIRILTIKSLDLSIVFTLQKERSHAAMMNAFPDSYPTTNQTFLEAYQASINLRAPGEYDPALERRVGTF